MRDPASAARRVLEDAALADRSEDRPGSFSSGLRQRLRLAAAWVAEPSILLLDEPSTNLDEAGRAWLWQRVRAISASAICLVATNQADEPGAAEPRLDLAKRVP
jgi:ABC-type multidrug transport system ATPase subunit